MLVSKKHKALILKLRDPKRVTTIIPTAREITADGVQYVAVPHKIEEVRVLRNIGFDAPSPISYHYAWPGRFTPFNAQREAAAFMTLNPRAFNLSEMGTSKTLATLWAYDYLRSVGHYDRVLVVAPLSTLERTWADEVFNHFPHLTWAVLHGSRERRLKLLAQDVDIYIINHDGLKVSGFVGALAHRPDINLVIVDEISQAARNAATDRFRDLRNICNCQHPRDVWGLTGTPIPNSPLDAWAQCRLVVPNNVPPYITKFKDQVMRQVSSYIWVPRDGSTDVVYAAMQPSIRFTRAEVVELPPTTYQARSVELTATQSKAYKEMMQKLVAEAENGQILAVNEAVKAQKLIQIACGVAYGADGEDVVLDAGPRLSLVRELVEEAGAKVIVFVPFVSVISMAADDLRTHGIQTEIIHGGVSKNERDRIFGEFQHGGDVRVIVAQPAAMSHGITLTAADTIIWYAPITSADTYLQANARIVRPGQKRNTLIVTIEGTPIERRYYERLTKKENVQGILLDMVQGGRSPA